jgi:ubiquinone/menaquinone biosynthesis C-methylase UbiE
MSAFTSGMTTVAYGAQQLGILVPATLTQRALRALGGSGAPAPDAGSLRLLHARLRRLFETDLANVERGLYPRSLLFSMPVATYARQLPSLLAELPRTIRRRRAAGWRELPEEVDAGSYPPYFRRTFHWQTDGYLSRRSARLYDVGVELLFAGTADVMRRQIIPPITEHLGATGDAGGKRLLDVACGTGRTLAQLALAHPELKLFGLDLSPYYLREAREVLDGVADVSLVADNAEAMPFAEASFDIVTSVYLFHELPKHARRNAIAEMYRVLRPGGLLVIEDSAQYAESSEIRFFLERFPEDFHEPFYRHYLEDDLRAPLEAAGFEVRSVAPCFVAKVLVAQKPLASRARA